MFRRKGSESAPIKSSGEQERRHPPYGARNLLIVVLESLRYDTWLAADVKNLSRIVAV